MAKRCFTLIKRVGLKPRLTVTGGCAKNQGLLLELKRMFQIDIAPLTVDPSSSGRSARQFWLPGRDKDFYLYHYTAVLNASVSEALHQSGLEARGKYTVSV